MGKKYIIEMKENERLYKAKLDAFNGPVIQEIAGAPYTEPDLEQVRKEAYQKGLKDSVARCLLREHCTKEAYQRGLSDAWEAARKIWEYDTTTLRKIFGDGIMRMDWFMRFTASEAIEKIRQYEQEQEEIKVGNEVKGGDDKYIVLQKHLNNIDEVMVVLFNRRNGEIDKWHLYNANGAIFKKTGRHFPEIADVLEKMREER